MRVLVIGVGGVGGYLAYSLIKCGVDMTIKARGEHLEAIKNRGLKVIDVDKEEIVYPKTEIDGKYDVVFVTTKSYSLDEIIKELKYYVNNDSVVIPILNGVEPFYKFKGYNIKKSCIYILSNIKSPGVIHKKTPLFYLCLENDDRLKNLFKDCNLKIKFSDNIEEDIWKKYLFISTFATLQSFYKKPTGWIMEQKRDEVEKFLDEVIKIAKEEGVDISNEKEKVIKQALNIPYESKMSMQIDFEQGNKTEVDNITGYLAKKSEFINFYYEKLKNFQ